MEHFEGIDLLQSVILFWERTENELRISIDAFLLPESPHYIIPPVKFFPCRRKGLLTFTDFSSVDGLKNIAAVKPNQGPHNRRDYGTFSHFEIEGDTCRIGGSLGDTVIKGGSAAFTVSE